MLFPPVTLSDVMHFFLLVCLLDLEFELCLVCFSSTFEVEIQSHGATSDVMMDA